MVLFDSIEDIFKEIRELGEYPTALVTLATALGALVIFIYFIKISYKLIQAFRLYVFSQLCCPGDLKKKYGQWAVISGSTDGIGLSMARELARRGMSIIVIARNEEKLAATKASLEEEPNVGEVITIKIDLSDSSLENFESIRDQIDPDNRDIGILINNAGTFPGKFQRYNRYDMDFLRRLVNLNVLATLHLTRMIMPGMVGRGKGLVANVSSILGAVPAPYMSVYAPTKTFIDSFSRQLQIEYSDHPIDIINLTPGAVFTKLFTATSSMPKPTAFNPTPDDYAKSALNAMSTGIRSISGTMMHAITLEMSKCFDQMGLIPTLFKINLKMNARDYELSPVPKRRKVVATSDGDATATTALGPSVSGDNNQ